MIVEGGELEVVDRACVSLDEGSVRLEASVFVGWEDTNDSTTSCLPWNLINEEKEKYCCEDSIGPNEVGLGLGVTGLDSLKALFVRLPYTLKVSSYLSNT